MDSSLKKRADEVLAGLIETVAKAAEIQAIQSAGLADMVDGLASNAKACKDSLNACSESGELPSSTTTTIQRMKTIALVICEMCDSGVRNR